MTTRIISTSLLSEVETSTKTTTTTKCSNGTTIIREEASTKLKSFNYVICDDPNNHSPFVNPTKISQESFPSVNKNKSNGASTLSSLSSCSSWSSWPKRSTTPTWILKMFVLLDNLFVSFWLQYVLQLWGTKISLSMKRSIIFFAWKYYVYIHTHVVCKYLGFYSKSNQSDISDEYKALSTLLYPSQFFQVTIPRMRFALGELNAVSLQEIPSESFVERIEYKMYNNSNNDNDNDDKNDNDNDNMIPESQRDHCTVRGLYIRNAPEATTVNNNNKRGKKKVKKVLFWIYGGAYLAGDAEGNTSLANEFIKDCNADSVFIPSYRLAPESNIDGVLWDVCLSYKFLLQKLQKEQEEFKQQQKEQETIETIEIVLIGISSGGALGLRLLQLIRDRSSSSGSSKEKKKPLIPSFLEPLIDDIIIGMQTTIVKIDIVGAVLFGPYIDYRNPLPSSDQSFYQNAQYDYIVNEAVQYYGLPYLDGFIPPTNENEDNDNNENNKNKNSIDNTNGRVVYSPITHDMNDLPPLCLIVSEHEVTYDMTIEIVNMVRNKATNADVTIGIWKHMCHVFSMLQAFVPEGKSSIQFAKEWIRTKTN